LAKKDRRDIIVLTDFSQVLEPTPKWAGKGMLILCISDAAKYKYPRTLKAKLFKKRTSLLVLS
jgi:hypothetical protein